MARILIADEVSETCDAVLRDAGHAVDRQPKISIEDLARAIAPYEGLVVRSRIKVPREVIEAGARLKVIGRAGAGVDNIDVAAAKARGVAVLNAPASNTRSVAEHVLALVLAFARQVPAGHAAMREGRWDRAKFMGWELAGKTLGLVGAGRIGRTLAAMARGLGMRVLAHSPPEAADAVLSRAIAAEGIELVGLDELLRTADIVSLHVPLDDTTRRMFSTAQLAAMKPTAILVNTSRGGVIDEAALAEALSAGKIAGACLDVYEPEPPPADHPFRRLPNVLATPHLAASTREAQERAAVEIARALVEFFQRS